MMAKVYPQTASSFSSSSSPSSSSSSSHFTEGSHTFTMWMKSLIFNGNGCTVFDSKGEIVYRIDNYNHKCSREVYLMDAKGHLLVTVLKRKLSLFGRWDGYKSNVSEAGENRPWFIVKKPCTILKGRIPCVVSLYMCKNQQNSYKIEGFKSGYKILKQTGAIVAEIKRKIGRSGVALGQDVFSLVVEPRADPSLIMGLVIVYSLMTGAM